MTNNTNSNLSSADAPINKKNLINKLCFIVTGTSLSEKSDELKARLLEYHQLSGSDLVSRVGIGHWFGRHSPGKSKAFAFLLGFIEDDVVYDKLSDNQKKVYNQLNNYLKSALKDSRPDEELKELTKNVSHGSAGTLIVKPTDIDNADHEAVYQSWVGVYVSYRRRLIDNASKPYARELVRLYRNNNGLYYKHWHLKDGVKLSSFEGAVLVTKQTLWFMGADSDNARFRICHFKRSESLNPDYQKYRWGLMHSDVPVDSSRDPASTRIFFKRYDSPNVTRQRLMD